MLICLLPLFPHNCEACLMLVAHGAMTVAQLLFQVPDKERMEKERKETFENTRKQVNGAKSEGDFSLFTRC